MFQNCKLANFCQTPYQSALAVITTIIIGLVTLKPVYIFKSFDRPPTLRPVSDTLAKTSSPITTGLTIKNFLDFDVSKNNFYVEGLAWFIFDPTKISLEEISQFSFSKGELIEGEFFTSSIDKKTVIDLPNKTKFVYFDMRLKFSTNLDYKMFPLNSHKFYITLVNKHIPIEKGFFVSQPTYFVVDENIYTPGWRNIGQEVKTGILEIKFTNDTKIEPLKFPRAIFSIDFMMDSMRYALFLFLPLLALFFVSLFALAIDPKKELDIIVPQTAGSLIGILTYRFVIEAVSPKVPYFTLVDHTFNLFLLLACITFVLSILKLSERARSISVLLLHVALITGWTFLIA